MIKTGKLYKDGKVVGCYILGQPNPVISFLKNNDFKLDLIEKKSQFEERLESNQLNLIQILPLDDDSLNKKQPNYHEQKNKYRFMNK